MQKRNSPCPMAVGTEAKRSYQYHYSTKKRLSKAQRAMLHDLFGSLLLVLCMCGLTMLMLIVG